MTCSHPGPCAHTLSARECDTMSRALARKYDVNLVWLFAELSPGVWCLYSPDRRTPAHIGTLEEIIEAYHARAPVIFTRVGIPEKRDERLSNLTFNI